MHPCRAFASRAESAHPLDLQGLGDDALWQHHQVVFVHAAAARVGGRRASARYGRLTMQREPSERTRAQRDCDGAFHALFELAPEAVVMGDSDQRVVDANAAACELYGYGRDEFRGMRLSDLVEPEDASKLAGERPSAGLNAVDEVRARRRDGTLVPVEVRTKVLPGGGSILFVYGVKERKPVEREVPLRRLGNVLKQSPAALAWVHARSGRSERNARMQRLLESFGITQAATSDEVLQGMWRNGEIRTADGQVLERGQSPAERALRGESLAGVEFRVPNASGSITWLSVNAGPIAGPDGAVWAAVVACEDITPQKELDRLRAEWSSVVAHDLRQPLGAILLRAQMLVRSSGDAGVLKHVEPIRAAANRLNRMVGDLMDLSRLEANRLELARQRVDVAALVRTVAAQARLQVADRPLDVRVHGTVSDVDADPDRITQVLENLLTNAVKYGDAGTPVAMNVESDGREVAVSVTNIGRGLTPAEIARMFERFHRTDSAKLQGIQGIGLGLYITRSLVEAHGGRITVESTSEGVTTFRFTLPAMAH